MSVWINPSAFFILHSGKTMSFRGNLHSGYYIMKELEEAGISQLYKETIENMSSQFGESILEDSEEKLKKLKEETSKDTES